MLIKNKKSIQNLSNETQKGLLKPFIVLYKL